MKRIISLSVLMAVALSGWTPATASDKPHLTVYTYDAFASKWGPGPKIESEFEKTCGCDLRFVALDSSIGILTRLQLEGSGSGADIALGLDASMLARARNSGLFAPHRIDIGPLTLNPQWTDGIFVPFDYGYFAFVYDSGRLTNPPASLAELADPGSATKIIIQDPRSSTPGLGLLLWIKAAFGDGAEDYWRRLAPKIVTVTKGWSEAYGLFLKGEADMVLSYTTSPAYHIIAEGKHQYRAASFRDGHFAQVEVAARLADAPHPALATAFLEFMLTEAFQRIIPTGNWMYPVVDISAELPPAFKDLVAPEKTLTLPAGRIERERKAWIAEFTRALSR